MKNDKWDKIAELVKEHYSWSALLSAIADNTQGSVLKVKEMIAEFLNSDMYK